MVSFCVLQNVTFSSFSLMSFFSKLRHTFWSHIKAYSALKVPLNPCRSISVYCHWHNKRWWWFLLENILLKGVFLKLILTSKIVRIELQLFGEEICHNSLCVSYSSRIEFWRQMRNCSTWCRRHCYFGWVWYVVFVLSSLFFLYLLQF